MTDNQTEHPKNLREWVELLEELAEEAKCRYPDGRVRVFVPGKKRQRRDSNPR